MFTQRSYFNATVRACLIGAITAGAIAVVSGSLMAAGRAERARLAEQLVQEALHREIYGLDQERQQLLEQALQQSEDYAPAMWHRGYVRYQNRWVKADEVPQLRDDDSRLVAYDKIRGRYDNTVGDQMALANWCRKRGLAQQERAHLTHVVTLNPDQVEARRRLGFRRVDGIWMKSAAIRRETEQLQQDRKALALWRSKIESLRDGLGRRNDQQRKTATERILAIDDASAIPALEAVLSRHNEAAAQLMIETLDNIGDHRAAVALARQAVFSPWENVRQSAVERLRKRSKDTYVPVLLSALYTPVTTNTELFRGPGGRIMYRHSFLREGQDQRDLLVLDTAFRRITQPGGDRNETAARAVLEARETALGRELAVLQQNQRTQALNDRVAWVLATATDQQYPATPQLWWQWWNQHNEVYVQGDKQIRTRRQSREVAISDIPQIVSLGGGSQARMDCLVAGTPVWTADGMTAIEKLQVGDLVLSQDPESGELAYKPVLQTTLRPKSRLIVIRTGDDTIRASGGHPFWVAGEGWIKARDLKPGMQLHGANGTVHVSSVETGSQEQTHNLIVADFNTYFVGRARVLNHDNTIREPIDTVVPGLAVQ